LTSCNELGYIPDDCIGNERVASAAPLLSKRSHDETARLPLPVSGQPVPGFSALGFSVLVFSASPRLHGEGSAVSKFFSIVVEVPEEDKALVRLMQVNLSIEAAIQLPDGCRFRTCFEISAEYAKVLVNM
jgi:hypothetical protein